MHDPQSSELIPSASPRSREGPEVMQAFVASHRHFFLLVALLLAQLVLLSLQITRRNNVRLIKIWTVTAFDPFERSVKGITGALSRTWRNYGGLWHAHQENQALQRELDTTRAQLQQVSQQAAETERLRTVLELKAHTPFQVVAAEIIASSPGATSNALYIDKGTDSGLAPDMAVINPAGVVGKIINAFRHNSQVLLITDPSSGVGGMMERSRVQGVLKGMSNNLCRLDYIMNEQIIAPGDTVVTSGLDQIYPKGLFLGRVVKVGDGNIYKSITVNPAAPLDQLETVLVVLKSLPEQEIAKSH